MCVLEFSSYLFQTSLYSKYLKGLSLRPQHTHVGINMAMMMIQNGNRKVCLVEENVAFVCISGPEQHTGRGARASVSRLSDHSRRPHGPQGRRVQETGEGHASAFWSRRH